MSERNKGMVVKRKQRNNCSGFVGGRGMGKQINRPYLPIYKRSLLELKIGEPYKMINVP